MTQLRARTQRRKLLNIPQKGDQKSTQSDAINFASISIVFIDGNPDKIKIVANTAGIQVLKKELTLAEKSIGSCKTYFLGDPLWLKGKPKLVALEPALSMNPIQPMDINNVSTRTNFSTYFLLGLVILMVFSRTIIGGITLLQWLF